MSRGLAGAAMRHAHQTPRNGFDGGEALDADDVARLVEVAADAIANDRGPAMETIRMQASLQFLVRHSLSKLVFFKPVSSIPHFYIYRVVHLVEDSLLLTLQ